MRESPATHDITSSHLRVGLLLAIGGTTLFALKSIFIKLAYAHGVDTITLLTLRMLVAAPVYLGVLVWLGREQGVARVLPREWGMLMGLGFLGYYLASWLDMQGLNHISAQLERLTLYTYPIMTTVLGWWLLREIITRRIVLALLLTYGGIWFLYGQEAALGGSHVTLGMGLVLASALSFACYVVFSKRLINRLGSALFTSVTMLAATLCVWSHFLLTHPLDSLGAITAPVWGYALLLGGISTVLPSFMVSTAIGRIGVARTSIVGSAGPMLTILLAVLWLGEPFGWAHLVGMLLVMLGVGLLGKR